MVDQKDVGDVIPLVPPSAPAISTLGRLTWDGDATQFAQEVCDALELVWSCRLQNSLLLTQLPHGTRSSHFDS